MVIPPPVHATPLIIIVLFEQFNSQSHIIDWTGNACITGANSSLLSNSCPAVNLLFYDASR